MLYTKMYLVNSVIFTQMTLKVENFYISCAKISKQPSWAGSKHHNILVEQFHKYIFKCIVLKLNKALKEKNIPLAATVWIILLLDILASILMFKTLAHLI